jgi:DNA-binding winged helix-turn-helix (wHTH) protein/Tfp pilus assembly protein PilF
MRVYQFGPFEVDIERLLLLHEGQPVGLGPKVVETLLALLEHAGEVVAKSRLLERIWPEGYVEEANLAQNIYVLRKTLRELAGIDAILTVPRRGYRFTVPAALLDRPSEAPAQSNRRVSPAPVWRWIGGLAAGFAAVVVLAVGGVAAVTHHSSPAQPNLTADGSRLYQLGSYYWNLRSREGVQRSLDYFAAVVRLNPHDARGYAALADANATMGDYHYGPLPPSVYFKRARSLVRTALSLDPNSAEALAALGLIDLDNGHAAKAMANLKRAIAFDPGYSPAHEWYGIALIGRGSLSAAFVELRTAADLDPLSVAATAWLGSAAYLDRHFNEAIAYSQETLDLAPQRTEMWTTIGEAYEAQGNYTRALYAFNRYGSSCAECRAEAAALLAHTEALQRRLVQARADLAYARAHASDVDPEDLAAAAAAIGDRSIAFALLRHLRGHLEWIAVKNDPRFDSLRDDASFRQLTQSQA